MWWYLLLALLAAEGALYFAAGWAAEGCRREARRDFNAAAARWLEVDKVPYAGLINRYARQEGVSAAVVAAIIRSESSFQPRAVSRTGAAGLMQVIPGTWREVNARAGICAGRHGGDCGPECYFDPELNIRVGTAYFAALTRQYHGDLVLALAAYNAGPGAVDKSGGVPPFPETEEYVGRVMAYWHAFAGRPVPAGGLDGERWEEARRAAAKAAAGTLVVAVFAAAGLRRRHRSWRWR